MMGKYDEKRIVRRLREEEQWKSDLVQAVCFEFPFDLAKARAERVKGVEEKEEKQKVSADCWGCFAEDDETLLGNITVSHFRTMFDGKDAWMGGVGGVSTMPQWRHGGIIRRCFEKALDDMYEKGFAFSALYPFSTRYYRKFGYENNACVCEWTVPLDAIAAEHQTGSIEQLLPGDDLSPLLDIYREFYRDYNLAVERKIYDASLEKENLLEQKRYLYLWKNEEGEPQGFMISRKTEDRVFDCTTGFGMKNGFLALNARAFAGMLAFVKNSLSAYYSSIRFTLPEHIRPDSLFSENNGIICRRYWNGMVRIVNVEQVLGMCRCRGEGSICIQVEDDMIPQNRGVWKITFAPGQENRVGRTEENPDVILPIRDLSVLLCGARASREMDWMPEVSVVNSGAPFEKIFYRKKCHILELF